MLAAYVSHGLTAHNSGSGLNGMLGFSAILVVGAGAGAATDFGVDGMLRFATLAQEVIG